MGTSCWRTSAKRHLGQRTRGRRFFLAGREDERQKKNRHPGQRVLHGRLNRWRCGSEVPEKENIPFAGLRARGPAPGAGYRDRSRLLHVASLIARFFRFGLHTPAFSESEAVSGIGMNPFRFLRAGCCPAAERQPRCDPCCSSGGPAARSGPRVVSVAPVVSVVSAQVVSRTDGAITLSCCWPRTPAGIAPEHRRREALPRAHGAI